MVMIADSVSCSIFNPTWPRETAPARATWDMSRVQKSCCCFCCNIISRLETSLAVPQASDVWASLKIAWKAPSWPTSLSGEIVQPWGRLELLTWAEVVTWRSLWQTFYSGAPGQTKAPPTIEFQLTAAPAGKNFFSFSSELKFQLESNSKNKQEQSN